MNWDNYHPQGEYFEKPRESTTWKYFKVGLGLMLGMGIFDTFFRSKTVTKRGGTIFYQKNY